MNQVIDIEQEHFWVPSTEKARRFFGENVYCNSWHGFWITMNWSSPVIPYEEWKKSILETDIRVHSMFENAIEYTAVAYFIYWFDPDLFVELWPKLRGFCPIRCFGPRNDYDIAWNVLAYDQDVIVPPLPSWNDLTKEERELLFEICSGETYTTKNDITDRLVENKFITRKDGKYIKNDFYKTFQYKRKPRRIKYILNGVRRECVVPADW